MKCKALTAHGQSSLMTHLFGCSFCFASRTLIIVTCSFLCVILGAATSNGQHLKVILIGDTADASIGKGCAKDLANMEALFRANCAATSHTAKKFDGSDPSRPKFSLKSLEDHVKELAPTVANDDAVILYFAGHGCLSKAGEHCLQFPDGTFVRRTDVKKLLKTLNPRLAVLITDTCSEYLPGVKPIEFRPRLHGMKSYNTPLFTSLFMHHEGICDISSTKLNECAWGTPKAGGIFTYSLCDYLSNVKNVNRSLSWQTAFTEARDHTNCTFVGQFPRGFEFGDNLVTSQNAHSFELATFSGGKPILDLPRLGVAIKDTDRGALVVAVVPNSAATQVRCNQKDYEIEPGNIISQVNGTLVKNAKECASLVEKADKATSLVVSSKGQNPTTFSVVLSE